MCFKHIQTQLRRTTRKKIETLNKLLCTIGNYKSSDVEAQFT